MQTQTNVQFVADYKTVIIENFQEAVKQYEWRMMLTNGDKESPHVIRHLIECQTYYGLLIQFGMTLNELNIMAQEVKVNFLGKQK